MEYRKFYINLLRSPERTEKFDDTWTRAPAVDWKNLDDEHHMYSRMISMWNLNPSEHKAKTACWLSHYNLLRKISDQRLMRCIVVEDDAEQMNEIPQDPRELGNEFCYLGGYFSHLKMTKGALKETVPSLRGLNHLNRESHRMLTTVAYYIPHYQIATNIIEYLDSLPRVRAIDVMAHSFPVPMNYVYPAIFVEGHSQSTIREKKTKHGNTDYLLA